MTTVASLSDARPGTLFLLVFLFSVEFVIVFVLVFPFSGDGC